VSRRLQSKDLPMPRLFTAIEVPDDIAAELYRLRMPLPGARWLKPENYHITLRFAGDITGVAAREFAANLAGIEMDGFELRISGLGAFGGDDPHAIWAGVEPQPQLEELARAHEKAARNAGLAPETRAFRPHVTLARLKHSNAEAVARFLTRFSGYRSEPLFVTRALLMSSRPGVGGGPYGIEERFPVRGMEFLNEDGEATW
jgi:2'-5' RNA ligase